ncbi:MAG: transposase [Gammaproteobacteria bacterium]|nr:transposase [Gammaproteobacteria bacterium]
MANAVCERTIGTIRRECLDYLIPMTGNHLRSVLRKWVIHFNAERPHSSLGPGIPDPPEGLPVPSQEHRHRISPRHRVACRSILGGLPEIIADYRSEVESFPLRQILAINHTHIPISRNAGMDDRGDL